jgi:hypothetical protein
VDTVCPKIGALGAAFYFTPETVARGKELGLDGFRFYFLGRGGVLGDVDARVIQSAFGYFNGPLVDKIWTSAKERAQISPREAAREYLKCAHDLARDKLTGLPELDAFNEAAAAVNAAVDPAGLALYAGVSAEPLPDDAAARAYHLIVVLREFRGSAHLLAVLASGLTAEMAHRIKRPADLATFGWSEDVTPTDSDRAALGSAEDLTDQLVLPAYSVLDEAGRTALVDGINAIEKAFA